MNYYEHHLGDYARDTTHLTMLEHGAYRMLLDRYYTREEGIPESQAYRVALARTDDERAAVDAVLEEFFTLTDGVWINNKAEEEISKARARINAAQANGKRGGRPKNNPDETQEKSDGLLVGSKTETQIKAHQSPDTNHQTPIKEGRLCTKQVSYPSAFEEFWKEYPTDALMSKKTAFTEWEKLSESDGLSAIAALPAFRDYCGKDPTYRPVHAWKFLSEKRFEGFCAAAPPSDLARDIALVNEIETAARIAREENSNGDGTSRRLVGSG